MPLKILVLYDRYTTHIKTIMEHLECFSKYSRHQIYYLPGTRDNKLGIDLSLFDVVVIHYSVRLSYSWHISPNVVQALKKYPGYKVLFIQDEYEATEQARQWIIELKIDLVYSCVPEEFISLVYPSSRFRNVEFINTLTGFVPGFADKHHQLRPLGNRDHVIGYRTRELPVWYGELAREKYLIGKRMKEVCEERQIKVNIEWDEEQRIYGDDWYKFLENCRVTLGAESGANVFDHYGKIKESVTQALKRCPELSYEALHSRFVAPYEGKVKMNQISPRVFEAIALGTGLVLFEGDYSGIISPNIHYIPLKKDFSNIDEVLNKILDNEYLKTMIDRTYADIVASGKYSYRNFVAKFDQTLENHVHSRVESTTITAVVGWQFDTSAPIQTTRGMRLVHMPLNIPLQYFAERGEKRAEGGAIRFLVDPIYHLFRENHTLANFIRYLYSFSPIRKLVNYLLR